MIETTDVLRWLFDRQRKEGREEGEVEVEGGCWVGRQSRGLGVEGGGGEWSEVIETTNVLRWLLDRKEGGGGGSRGLSVEGEGGGWSEMIETTDVVRRLLDRQQKGGGRGHGKGPL